MKQGFCGKEDELMPTSEVVKVIRDSLALIGNASAYIAQCRRQAIIDKVKPTGPQLAGFMKEICKEGMEEAGKDLFGPELKKKMNERADTIKAFNKALVTLDPPGTSKQKPQHTKNVGFFWGKAWGRGTAAIQARIPGCTTHQEFSNQTTGTNPNAHSRTTTQVWQDRSTKHSTRRRETETLRRSMVTFDSESLDIANGTGSSAGFQEPPTGISTSYKGAAPQTADGSIGTGNPGSFAEGC